jgi:Flp pilus assembly protein TadG
LFSPMQPKFRNRHGQALAMVTISLFFMFVVMGLSIDLGWSYFLKIRVRTAAVAAAMSAANYARNNYDSCATVSCGVTYNCAGVTPPTTSLEAGCLYATQDGPPSMAASLIENNTTPLPGNNPSMWVKATVSTASPNFFLYLGGYKKAVIAAQAYAGITTIPSAGCIYVLDSSAADAYSQTGSETVSTACGLFVNSTSASALYMYGSPTLTATGGAQIKVNGGTSISAASKATPTPITHAGPVTDPLANRAYPTVDATCDKTNWDSGKTGTFSFTDKFSTTSHHYTFCGGFDLHGTSTASFAPGVYIINGGSTTVANSAQLSGTGVEFFLTGKSGIALGPLTISGNPVVNLTAPVPGAANTDSQQGIVFRQDARYTYSATNTIANSSSGNIQGTMYFKTTALAYTGNPTATYSAIIADTLSITGSATIKQDATGQYTGLAQPIVSLIQ